MAPEIGQEGCSAQSDIVSLGYLLQLLIDAEMIKNVPTFVMEWIQTSQSEDRDSQPSLESLTEETNKLVELF